MGTLGGAPRFLVNTVDDLPGVYRVEWTALSTTRDHTGVAAVLPPLSTRVSNAFAIVVDK